MKVDSGLRPEEPKGNIFFSSIFNFVLWPDFLWSAADSAGSTVKRFGGWLTKN